MSDDYKIEESTFYKAGLEDRKRGIPIEKSGIRLLRFGCSQYDEFIAGYDSIPVKPRKKKAAGDVT